VKRKEVMKLLLPALREEGRIELIQHGNEDEKQEE